MNYNCIRNPQNCSSYASALSTARKMIGRATPGNTEEESGFSDIDENSGSEEIAQLRIIVDKLAKILPDEPVGVYAGTDKSANTRNLDKR
jgi:hypothetical protein